MWPTLRAQRLRLPWLLVVPFLVFASPTPGSLQAGSLLALPGLLLRGWAAAHVYKDRALAIRGPYAHLRHPLYLGSFLVGSGLAVAGGRWVFPPLFLVLFLLFYGRTIRAEERDLEVRFGEAYRRYRERVPPFLPRPGRTFRTGDPGRHGDGGTLLVEVDAEKGDLPPAPTPSPPPGLPRFRRNKEWQAALGTAVGFALLWLRMRVGG